MLFTRSTREVALTELGQAWLPKVRDALRGIDAAVDDLIASVGALPPRSGWVI